MLANRIVASQRGFVFEAREVSDIVGRSRLRGAETHASSPQMPGGQAARSTCSTSWPIYYNLPLI